MRQLNFALTATLATILALLLSQSYRSDFATAQAALPTSVQGLRLRTESLVDTTLQVSEKEHLLLVTSASCQPSDSALTVFSRSARVRSNRYRHLQHVGSWAAISALSNCA